VHILTTKNNIHFSLKRFIRYLYYSKTLSIVRPIVFSILLKVQNRLTFIDSKENFYKLQICSKKKHLPGYIKIYLHTNGKLSEIDLPDSSTEIIKVCLTNDRLDEKMMILAMQNWWKMLIPGGILLINFYDFEQFSKSCFGGNPSENNNRQKLSLCNPWEYNITKVKKCLIENGFKVVKITPGITQTGKNIIDIRLEAYKSIPGNYQFSLDQEWIEREKKRPETLTINWRKDHIHAKILNEHISELFVNKDALSIGCGTGELEVLLGLDNYSINGVDVSEKAIKIANNHKKATNVCSVAFQNASIYSLPFSNNTFDSGYAIEVLEHIEPDKIKLAFSEIQRVLVPNAKFLLTIPNMNAYYDPGHHQFFTKATFVELLDKINISLDWVDLEEREDKYIKHDLIKAMLINRPAFEIRQSKKICAIGAYEHLGYSQLGFHWDGQARAFKTLGFEVLLLDIIVDDNFQNMMEKIQEFGPHILWLGLDTCLDFLWKMKNNIIKLKNNGCKVIYWFCDLRKPKKMNLGDLIDMIFISNAGQIDEYRSAYQVDKVYYMPQACTPAFMHKLDLDEKHQIGFTTTLTSGYHEKRKSLVKKLNSRYNLILSKNTRNYINNYYSKSKIAMGMNLDSVEYLYTSNRFFIALGCGAFYLCEWFPGIEKLGKNHESLVWFKNEYDMFELVDYYLKNTEKRFSIRKNAQSLAHNKHTYVHRVQNMLDIIDGKTNDFYGLSRVILFPRCGVTIFPTCFII
jgi:ubiquinone/menaquinone biosynthesis C-methylase UbiE